MGDPSFGFRVGLALRRALPYLNDGGPQSQFFEAATRGDVSRLRELASGKDAEGKARLADDISFSGIGPLQAAARLGEAEACRCMVEELGFDINTGGELGITALASAALDGRLATARYFLDHGADPNKKCNAGSVPLHCAAKKFEYPCRGIKEGMVDLTDFLGDGHDEVAQLLLSRGASIDIAYFHGTPLHVAAAYGKASVMKVLLEHHADPNKVSEELGTPLVATLHATSQGLAESISLKCVKLLVEAGADGNFSDRDTPLVVAITNGLTDCINYLLKAGADPNIPTCHCGALPIQLAASYGRRKDVELLFPLTSRIRAVSNWTVEGILAHTKSKHARSKCSKPKNKQDDHNKKAQFKLRGEKAIKDEQDDQNKKAQLKLSGEKAVKRKDYRGASIFYTEAIELDPTDATLYSNRSLCHLQMADAVAALFDADCCIKSRPEWLKGYYRKGAALMLLKEYEKACDAFMAGLKLDPLNAEMEKVFREAVEAMKKHHVATKSFKPSD